MKKHFTIYNLHFAICFILLSFLSGCGQDISSSTISPDAIEVTFKALEAPVSGMWATLQISGMTGSNSDGSYPMTVNSDGSVTASVSGVPAGTHTFTITYYDASGLIIAQATTSGNVTSGANTTISISSSQLNTSFDEDADGFTNLEEINSGSDPKDPTSMPAPPSAPTGVIATAGDAQVSISWPAVSGATSYNIYWSTTTGVTKTTGTKIPGVTSPYAHTGLTNNTTYYYIVTAVNSLSESAESAQVSATPQATGTWTTTGAMNQARLWHVAILLSSGKVLAAGGGINPQPLGRGDYLDTAELYDPTTGTFTYTGSMNVKRGWHTSPGGAVLLNNGKVLVVGGYFDDGTQLISHKSAELFDPSTGVFSYTGSMNNISGGHVTAILLQSGKVLVTGGSYAEVYDPSTGTFSLADNPIYSRMMYTATLLSNGKVLITGGHTGTVALSTAEVYDPVTGTFSQTGNMNYQRWLHTATLLPDGRVLITGGTSSNSTQQQDDASILSSAEIYDPSTGTFSLTGTMNYPRITHTATPLSNGNVLIAGGSGGSSIGSPANAEFYDPSVGQFRIGSSMITPRSNHLATLLSSGQVLVAGGNYGTELRSAELFTPP